MSVFDWFRSSSRKHTTHETVEAMRAVQTIAEAVKADEPVPDHAVETINRVLTPPVAWEQLLRESARRRSAEVCRR